MLEISDQKIKILVIDDDRIIQIVLKQTLQGQGYEVILASSGTQGVEQAYQHHPALIICDWQMDEMDGLEVCRIIKSEPSLSTTFFILLTARTAIADRVEGLDNGADDFLSKPIDVSELKARVRAGLRLYQTNQELQRLAQDLQIQKQLLETELNEAAEYVKSILPESMSGLVTINSRFLPSSQLGGDCFDYYWLDKDNLVIYLLDVSGHGLAAAFPSIFVHNLLRSQSLPKANFYQPSAVLNALNEVFHMEKHNARYFTIWYGVFNRISNQLTYSTAGHPPALLLSQSTESSIDIKQLITPSMPIGAFAESEYQNAVCDIQASSKIYVFSDGVYEIEQPDGSLWNLNGFINLLTRYNQKNEMDLDDIIEGIKTETGNQLFTDDCSLLEISFTSIEL
ncbi:SpoIIE family protein phosphatase [Anabaena cylindrica FACHB-243]|uniref:Response regulator receiver modulated serine phosphatase n=1 Tax=Anabaena cylindrica (strain ATCC 27899 / PCC 7122) TaxID=272123 RepID=K9ZHH6_ANACC|nr:MULTISPECIES: SpoIIE family protein phosphatase [Anabaena]AFZ58646.1 response regulator receiver modulated serine phosphatase [Anabaena cylindrica PCC 7122]MBD2419991.1 SpoIIE family protein phosphatase [Anabaena cylindrica FACHB-243]MBY5283038.1 SpoIIE family protein phosphatase [Anabaena sp. CCAP 1446/1C]MBY5306463.1 SpoIIE family protein phosphatase [Anabaena sp. CCAP 1446/1C]MCM2407115.1 SpoIIE family protein phosphatase [Anabaena sp. CCAP 1446/1C]